MDGGEIGVLINAANRQASGHFFAVRSCTGPEHDNAQISPVGSSGARAVYLVSGGRVRAVGVASRADAASARTLRGDVRAAGL